MAFQRGPVKLEGKMGDFSFYKVDDNFLAKQKSGHSKERINNDPSFERTRENAIEFGNASSFAKHLKLSLKQSLGRSFELFSDPSLTNRLNKRINSIVKADSVHARGSRQLLNDNLLLFTGFSLNNAAALKDTFFIPLVPEWLVTEKLIRLELPQFLPRSVSDAPDKAALFQFHICATMRVDEGFQSISMHSELFALDTFQEAQNLDLLLGDTNADATIVFFGISFFSEVAGYAVPLTTPCKNALDVIKVFIPS
jgi:hypothetical protein